MIGAQVAFLGNSILYFNDCPRFFVNLGQGSVARQDSCLRGGTNLAELWDQGNGMRQHGFATAAAKTGAGGSDGGDAYDVGAPTVRALLGGADGGGSAGGRTTWDFAVLNDHTQGPARSASREAARTVLLERYLPLLLASGATPVFVETAAYLVPGIHGSADLGSADEFQRRVREGLRAYVDALRPRLPPAQAPRLAPVGAAFACVRDRDRALFERLFDPYDHFHPSATGTFLQGCVLHCTLFGRSPPLPRTEADTANLWRDSRIKHRSGREKRQRLPSVMDVEYLWGIANEVCASHSDISQV